MNGYSALLVWCAEQKKRNVIVWLGLDALLKRESNVRFADARFSASAQRRNLGRGWQRASARQQFEFFVAPDERIAVCFCAVLQTGLRRQWFAGPAMQKSAPSNPSM